MAATDATAFETAAVEVKKLTRKPTNTELLNLYALYKQGTDGDCTTPKPSDDDMKEFAKWGAWNKLKGKKTKEVAQADYVKLVATLKTKYGYAA
ncbi:acyl-CoA-binding protein [Pelomyxa schiedti]|nr:acyl-CoA-binding protein [Pelomyxa schiedti]